METTLREIQMAQLDVALEVKRLCEKYNISYFLVGGTALGAVRHEGFIPWDDDLDIGMFRSEFDRFKKVCSKELDPAYFYQDMETDPGYALPFAKIRIKNTVFEEDAAMHAKATRGVFVDIFPLDNTATTLKEESKYQKKFYVLFRAMLAKQGYRPADNNWKKRIAYGLLKLYPASKKTLRKKMNAIMKQYRNSWSQNVVNYGGSYGYWKERLCKDWFIYAKPAMFEGYEFPLPGKTHDYLCKLYGDYMKLPPEDKRGDRHRIIDADLRAYKIRNLKYQQEQGEQNVRV